MNNTTLKEILSKNSTWNATAQTNFSVGTDKDTTHNYIEGFYDKKFKNYKYKKINILEIGLMTGHSLLLWDEYFTDKHIYGIDIDDHKNNLVYNNKNITTKISNAYTQETLDSLPNLDIVIDDGPHTLESMISCIELYLPKINKNGVLIIEDVQSFDWIDILKTKVSKELQNNIEIVDLRSTKGRYDDLMFVVNI